MKARIENGSIMIVSSLPNEFNNTVGGYDKLSESVHRADGWRDVVETEIDPVMQSLGEPYFDEEADVVRFNVIDKQFDIVVEKQAKISQAKQQANALLSVTDWYVTRFTETGTAIPAEVVAARAAIRARSNAIETEIGALTLVRDVLVYQIDYTI